MIACVFPGQGSQHMGMGQSFYQNFSIANQALEWASDHLSINMKDWFENSTDQELKDTERTQVMLFLTSLMAVKVLEKEGGKALPAHHVAGHSLGEYTALWSAGVWSDENALSLVRKRGLAMKKAAQNSQNNGMMAVLGLDAETLDVLTQATECVIANDNCPGQVVLSGSISELESFQEALKEAGAKRCVMLPVSGAFHSPFMQLAANEMEPFLKETPANKPRFPVWMNVTANPLDDDVAPLMVQQITHGVRWRSTIENMHKVGAEVFIEIGAGKVLTQLGGRNAPDAEHINFSTTEQLDAVLEKISKA